MSYAPARGRIFNIFAFNADSHHVSLAKKEPKNNAYMRGNIDILLFQYKILFDRSRIIVRGAPMEGRQPCTTHGRNTFEVWIEWTLALVFLFGGFVLGMARAFHVSLFGLPEIPIFGAALLMLIGLFLCSTNIHEDVYDGRGITSWIFKRMSRRKWIVTDQYPGE